MPRPCGDQQGGLSTNPALHSSPPALDSAIGSSPMRQVACPEQGANCERKDLCHWSVLHVKRNPRSELGVAEL